MLASCSMIIACSYVQSYSVAQYVVCKACNDYSYAGLKIAWGFGQKRPLRYFGPLTFTSEGTGVLLSFRITLSGILCTLLICQAPYFHRQRAQRAPHLK